MKVFENFQLLICLLLLTFTAPAWAQSEGATGRINSANTSVVPASEAPLVKPPICVGNCPKIFPPIKIPVNRPKLEQITLEANLSGQKAKCVLKYVFYNSGNSILEVDFMAPLPEGGQVSGLTLMDGSTELPGKIYPKKEAWDIYQNIVRRLKDPALLEYAGQDTFRARVFPLPPGERRTLELNFDYLLPKNDDQVYFNFPLAGPLTVGQNPKQEVHVVLKGAPGLGGIYSPLAGVEIKKVREGGQDGGAVASFAAEKTPVINRFQLYYNLKSGPLGALMLSHRPADKQQDGFFLLLADPQITPEFSLNPESKSVKNVIFVLDKSGSMNGAKFEQAKGALKFVLERLEDQDNFNLVSYSSQVDLWQPEIMAMTKENRGTALNYVENLRSGGATNIEEALKVAFGLVEGGSSIPTYIIFLTDGQPTSGVTSELQLAEMAKGFNNEQDDRQKARLFAFGVGYNVNARLLDRLSGQAGGTSVFVSPDENLESRVSTFFTRLTTPALTRPKLSAGKPINRVLPQNMPDLFIGQQQVVVGRYPQGGITSFTLAGNIGDKKEAFTYEVDLAEIPTPDGEFIAGIWAQRRIGEIIDALDLAGTEKDPNSELVSELVELSKKYGILTPYTSFLALEDQSFSQPKALVPLAKRNLEVMAETVGSQANYQRSYKSNLKVSASMAPPRSSKVQADMVEMSALDSVVSQAGPNKQFSQPQSWAGQTFFFKDGSWQAENISKEDLAKYRTISQLSDEYFKLGLKLRSEEMVWLAQPEPVMFKHGGQVYFIKPAV